MTNKTTWKPCGGCDYARFINRELFLDEMENGMHDWVCTNKKSLQHGESVMHFRGCINRSEK